MSSEYFHSIGGKSVVSGKQFTLRSDSEQVRQLSANDIFMAQTYLPK